MGLFLFLITIAWAVVWGYATRKVIENKGYSEDWFWWGFWFGFIAFIVALTRPSLPAQYVASPSRDDEMLRHGGWQCQKCGRVNAAYVSSCGCGTTLETSRKFSENTKEKSLSELERLQLLKEYKDLLDTGMITQEEFEKKKATLLT